MLKAERSSSLHQDLYIGIRRGSAFGYTVKRHAIVTLGDTTLGASTLGESDTRHIDVTIVVPLTAIPILASKLVAITTVITQVVHSIVYSMPS